MSVKPGSPRLGEDTTGISNKIPVNSEEGRQWQGSECFSSEEGGFLSLVLQLFR